MSANNSHNSVVVYQSECGALELKGDPSGDTIWASLNQIAELFNVQKAAISKHLTNIYRSGELEMTATVSKMETVQIEGKREVKRTIDYYNLDAIISVGYRVNSQKATQFRIWATDTLREHLISGFTINKSRIGKNYDRLLTAVDEVKGLLPEQHHFSAEDALELMRTFAVAWFSLDAYDKGNFPTVGLTQAEIEFSAKELTERLEGLKMHLIEKGQATELFGRETKQDSIAGIIGNVFQSFDGQELYPSIEEKAANLLYFIVKNHPFVDGNKRSGAFAFVWLLRKAKVLPKSLTPEALTSMTLLIAESDPSRKEKMIGTVLLLLNRRVSDC